MATVTRGYTFGATEQVTNSKLHTLVDGASVTSLAQSDVVSGEGFVHRGTSAPSDTDQLWADTSLTPVILKVYDGSNWVPTDELSLLTNSSGVSLVAGNVVIVDTANSERVKTTSTQGDVKWRGIAVATVANSSTGVFKTHGYVPNVFLETSASAGCFLTCSTATGKAVQVASGNVGIFGIVTTSGTASAAAYLFGSANQGSFTPTASNALTKSVVQVVNTQNVTKSTGSTALPFDDTIPQITEGDLVLTQAITPNNASNTLRIDVVAFLSSNGVAINTIALFQDATAGALCASFSNGSAYANDKPTCLKMTYYMTAGTTSSTSFTIRGGGASGTTTFNGTAGNRLFGGVLTSSITITEYKA